MNIIGPHLLVREMSWPPEVNRELSMSSATDESSSACLACHPVDSSVSPSDSTSSATRAAVTSEAPVMFMSFPIIPEVNPALVNVIAKSMISAVAAIRCG